MSKKAFGTTKTKLIRVDGGSAYAHSEVTFIREDADGDQYSIGACKCYESWEQWGAPISVLSDNVEAVEAWRRGLLKKGWIERDSTSWMSEEG